MKNSIQLILISFFCACSLSTDQIIEHEKLTFNYTDDAYIFFRNIRQSNYDLETLEKADWRIYRHEDRPQNTRYSFNTAIVVNWRINKAYAILEINEKIIKENLTIYWNDAKGNKEGKIILQELQRQQELAFLTEIYNHILQEHQLSWTPDGQNQAPLFCNNDHKEAFRISMYDFYRLTGVL
ncbi:hypothetical protein GCM10011506_25700 [Marivirga lumbricoides]|uniref:Lipoprotein n=1 Tax=Marivirga lumbricoides TaxID=1046115 RepID=A0ABQ1ME78_9BACT|nr:hypothetical protein GCM10011506_25700 [Marivirga lumbricoides]